uniref:Uncharacterized protein n=1 Tax=Anguilla anguilla TaxID=7936 RepID=A0A0E9R3H5_ANGAN
MLSNGIYFLVIAHRGSYTCIGVLSKWTLYCRFTNS